MTWHPIKVGNSSKYFFKMFFGLVFPASFNEVAKRLIYDVLLLRWSSQIDSLLDFLMVTLAKVKMRNLEKILTWKYVWRHLLLFVYERSKCLDFDNIFRVFTEFWPWILENVLLINEESLVIMKNIYFF